MNNIQKLNSDVSAENGTKPNVGSSAAHSAEKKYKCSGCGQIIWMEADVAGLMTYCENAGVEAQFVLQE